MVTKLRVVNDPSDPTRFSTVGDYPAVQRALARHDIHLEHRKVIGVSDPATHPHVLELVHQHVIDELCGQGLYETFDFIGVDDEHPAKEELRGLFLDEHTHGEDEARLFLHGAGMFAFHVDEAVLLLTAVKGDFIRVPGGMRHWFDMGRRPDFTAVRFFNNPDGWIPFYTGDVIAQRFPTFEAVTDVPRAVTITSCVAPEDGETVLDVLARRR